MTSHVKTRRFCAGPQTEIQAKNIVGVNFFNFEIFTKSQSQKCVEDPVNVSSENLIPNIAFCVIFWQLVCSKLL